MRKTWDELPSDLRQAIEQQLGGTVLTVDAKKGGYTAGMASVLKTADRSVFVKAIPASDGQAESYRREAQNVKRLPEGVPVPRVVFGMERDDWVAVGFDAVDGTVLSDDMTQSEVHEVIDAIKAFQPLLSPSPISDLRPFSSVVEFKTWQTLQAEGAVGALTLDALPTSLRSKLAELAALEEQASAAVVGSSLLHLDIRHDNVVRDRDKKLWFVDWSWPCLGAPWVDVVAFLATTSAAIDHQQALARYDPEGDLRAEDVNSFIVSLMGYWLSSSLEPGFAHAPGLRPYQATSAANAAAWLAQRGVINSVEQQVTPTDQKL